MSKVQVAILDAEGNELTTHMDHIPRVGDHLGFPSGDFPGTELLVEKVVWHFDEEDEMTIVNIHVAGKMPE